MFNAALTTQLTMLKAQAKDLPRQQAKLAAVAAKIPDNPAVPALLRALDKAADSADVELVSVAPSEPAPVQAVGSTPAAAAPGAAPAGAAGGLSSITLTFNVVGGYFQVESFLDHLEGLTRAMKVTSFTLAPGSNPVKPGAGSTSTADSGKVLTGAITSQVYLAGSSSATGTTGTGAAATPSAAAKALPAGTTSTTTR